MPKWSIAGSGTQLASVGEDMIFIGTQQGDYVLWIDLNNLAAGDGFTLRWYETVLGAGYRLGGEASYIGANLVTRAAMSPEIPIGNGVKFTLQQTAGTKKNFPWQVLKSDFAATLMGQVCL